MRAPRPVAGLPAVDATELAKAWLLELMASAPLEQAARIPVADLAREAPALVAAIVAAVADDGALGRLAEPTHGLPEPEATPAVLAARAGALAGAGDQQATLHAVEALRATIHQALRSDDAQVQADTANRLAHVTTRVATTALASFFDAGVPAPHIEAHDHRQASGHWTSLIARALDRHATDNEPFALLAGEVSDRERWLAADARAIDDAAAAVTAHLRPGDRLVAEQPGRWWIVAPDTDAVAARELATSLAEAVERAGRAGVAFGVSACPHDGIDAEALVAHADEALFAARAAGLPVA